VVRVDSGTIGVYGCVGKNLALMNLRVVTTRLLRNFEFRLAEGTTEEKMYKESRDLFVIYLGGIELLLKERELK
jgi:tryprostatin B 6-hydroxylase